MSDTVTDRFGRVWSVTGEVYAIDIPDDGTGERLTISVTNSDHQRALDTINSLAPAGWVEP